MNATFSHALSHLRHEKGISQRQAAQDLGLSQALLSHYENGVREPGLAFVVRACDYYQVSADYLLGRTTDRGEGKALTRPEHDPAALMRTADNLSSLCADLCRKEPELGILFKRLAGQINRDLSKLQKEEDG